MNPINDWILFRTLRESTMMHIILDRILNTISYQSYRSWIQKGSLKGADMLTSQYDSWINESLLSLFSHLPHPLPWYAQHCRKYRKCKLTCALTIRRIAGTSPSERRDYVRDRRSGVSPRIARLSPGLLLEQRFSCRPRTSSRLSKGPVAREPSRRRISNS